MIRPCRPFAALSVMLAMFVSAFAACAADVAAPPSAGLDESLETQHFGDEEGWLDIEVGRLAETGELAAVVRAGTPADERELMVRFDEELPAELLEVRRAAPQAALQAAVEQARVRLEANPVDVVALAAQELTTAPIAVDGELGQSRQALAATSGSGPGRCFGSCWGLDEPKQQACVDLCTCIYVEGGSAWSCLRHWK